MASSRATFYALKANIRGGGYEGDKDGLVELFNQTQKPKEYLISSTPKAWVGIHPDDFGDRFNIREEELYAYLGGFVKTYLNKVNTVIPQLGTDEEDLRDLLNGSASDDNDIKLSLYRSFKSIYDKWISNSEAGFEKRPFYNEGDDKERPKKNRLLFDHFSFVNRGFSDIGSEAVIDPTYILKMAEEPTMTLYQLITEVLSKNNFDFFPLPGYINYSDSGQNGIPDEDLKDMFRPIDDLEDIEASPSFICMYVGGSSRTLDIKNLSTSCENGSLAFEYEDDSFAVDEDFDLPPEFVEGNGGGITAFKVAYGAENQSHFFNLDIDQSEFKETQESLAVIDQLVNPKEGSGPSKATKGNNLYDVYLTRSYKCTVETLGNMMIQPLMYFKLENVPMFHGTYLITDVKHTVKPHNVKTTFTGVRQPLVSIPIVTDPISIFNLSATDIQDDDTKLTDLEREFGGNIKSQGTGNGGFNVLSNADPNTLVRIDSEPVKDTPKFLDVIRVMENKQGVFDSRKGATNPRGYDLVTNGVLFKDVKDELIADGIYDPNRSYIIYDEPFVMNVVGIRNFIQKSNSFDDFLAVFYVDPKGKHTYNGKKWSYKAWSITTEPGSTVLGNASGLGAGIFAEGQFLGSHHTGIHYTYSGMHNSSTPILVYRDDDRNQWAQKSTDKLRVFIPGMNIHASGPYDGGETKEVGGWSAGCQVFRNPKDYIEYMYLMLIVARNEERGNKTTSIKFNNKGGCNNCSKFLSDFIPENLKSALAENTTVPQRWFTYTLLNSTDFGNPNRKTGDLVYEHYINSGAHSV